MLSPTGRYVVFTSEASDLVGGDTNARTDVFIRDRDIDRDGNFDESGDAATELISVGNGGPANGDSGGMRSVALSSDGRFVAFASHASNLVSGDNNFNDDVFVRDRLNDTTIRVSTSDSGSEGNSASMAPSISSDGRFVAFHSWANNLSTTPDLNADSDVFVKDLTTETQIQTTGRLRSVVVTKTVP